jgi:tetratricopeptide (TPR) repeat protein
MSRDLDADLRMLQRVLALAQARDIDGAATLAQQALDEGFEHPLLLNVVATRDEQQGRFDDALRRLSRGVEIAPDDIPVRNALALCLQRLDRPADALVQVDELLRREPGLAFAHANRGNALVALGRLGQARESHLKAIELEPTNLAALAALASIATHRGEHADARAYANRALALVPGYPDAVLSLASADLAAGQLASAEAQLRSLIADPRAGLLDRSRAHGLLGDVLDAAGRHADAFAAYADCNDAQRRIYARHAALGSVADYAESMGAALERIAPRWTHRPASAAPHRAKEHVFLMGFPRSGTTLLEVVLDGHPDVVSLEEHELLGDGVLAYLREPLDLAALESAGDADLQMLRQAYWDGVARAGVAVKGRVFIDKHPLNTLKLPLIARLFPDAKVLFAIRDPRDVVLSCFRRRFKMNPAMYQMLTLEGAARLYAATMRVAELARPALGLAWREVRYERVIADFTGEMRSLCDFLGIAWTDEMGAFAARVQRREHSTPSTAQLARGLDRSGLAHWRHYAGPLESVAGILAPWIERFGVRPPV